MTDVSHASLTGAQLHEPKGADTAIAGTAYVANGSGSGSWSSIGISSLTGMVADFIAPLVPSGWLELDGSVISSSTYSALYGVMTIPTTGTRTSGSAIITSIPDTSSLHSGYYVFGTGIASGTTIVSVDSSTQITVSNTASTSGTSAISISPWLLNTGTIQLPDLTTSGRYRRSRSSGTAIGQTQADQNQAHTHTTSGTTNDPGNHTHGVTDPTHRHTEQAHSGGGGGASGVKLETAVDLTTALTNTVSDFAATGISINAAGSHTHTVTGTAASSGGTEARPLTIIFMTCVKT